MSIDKHFIRNIIRNSYLSVLIIGFFLYLLKNHLPEKFAEGFTYGAVCGVTNLVFLAKVIGATINEKEKTGCAAGIFWGLGLLGILIAYCYVFYEHWFNDVAMVVGFSYVLGMIVFGAVFKKPERGSVE